jgi:ABC-type Fe3+/spermidine/putrescine transport system ATPase subunit
LSAIIHPTAHPDQPLLRVDQVTKKYSGAALPAVSSASFDLASDSVICLLGPSGCGKTTLLRLIAGLEKPDHGHITFAGRDFALFPHKTVAENVAFGLHMSNMRHQEIQARVEEMLHLVSLAGYGNRNVDSLSGGERQRVALARSLALQPKLLLLDEPLASLDRKLRDELMLQLRIILKELHLPAVYVTHDQEEAYAVADYIAIMRQGEIVQIAEPDAIYRHPASRFVATFLGFDNFLSILGVTQSPPTLQTSIGTIPMPPDQPLPTSPSLLLLRPDTASLAPHITGHEMPQTNQNVPVAITGTLARLLYRGNRYDITLDVNGVDPPLRLQFEIPLSTLAGTLSTKQTILQPGMPLKIYIDTSQSTILRENE